MEVWYVGEDCLKAKARNNIFGEIEIAVSKKVDQKQTKWKKPTTFCGHLEKRLWLNDNENEPFRLYTIAEKRRYFHIKVNYYYSYNGVINAAGNTEAI